jgi:hypothetical protein
MLLRVMTIVIEGYVEQQKLATVLRTVVGASAWRGAEVRVVAGRRQRWDMVYEAEDGGTVAVEFDGPEHYRNSLKIKADREKDEIASRANVRIVRFPYWVQLTSETLLHYFGREARVVQSFAHGFITTKLFPASFCELGVERFVRELDELPGSVRSSVIASLRHRTEEHGIEYVMPQELRLLLATA